MITEKTHRKSLVRQHGRQRSIRIEYLSPQLEFFPRLFGEWHVTLISDIKTGLWRKIRIERDPPGWNGYGRRSFHLAWNGERLAESTDGIQLREEYTQLYDLIVMALTVNDWRPDDD